MTVAGLCVLGATGSIGEATLAVARHLALPVHSVSAGSRVDRLSALARGAGAEGAHIADPARLPDLRAALAGSGIAARSGEEDLCALAADPAVATVMAAIVGGAGLGPILAAVDAGKRVCIANKEPLVMAGDLIMAAAQASGAAILPVDSEHAALARCLQGHRSADIARLVITGSGGPLRDRIDLEGVTPEEALCHPTWQMGPKITVDSATMMNKALELIEARHLFAVPVERIDILIHPQSIVHGLVAWRDGTLTAALAAPDMRLPIQQALTWPDHAAGMLAPPDLAALGHLDFSHPDGDRYPAVALGYEAARRGGLAPVVLNAANECAVELFLAGRIDYQTIVAMAEHALAAVVGSADDLATIQACDAEIRQRYRQGLPR